jgi:hypothetical protein
MIVRTLLSQSIRNFTKSRSIGMVVAALTTLAICTPAIGTEKPTRLSLQATAPLPANITPAANGVYLYGESDRPDVVGKEYMVFETTNNQAIGAFYLPQSEFSCFYGQFKGSRLNITLIDTYDRQKYNFTFALNPNGLTASKQPMMGEPTYQPLGSKISTNERQILDACKQQLKG